MELTDSIETSEFGISRVIVSEKEEIKCNNKIKWYEQD